MSFKYIDVLKARRLKLEYVSPPICEADFTGSGEPVLSLSPLSALVSPTGLLWDFFGAGYRMSWNAYDGALCYTIYRAVDEENPLEGEYVIVAECISGTIFDTEIPGYYRVSAITPEGETPISEPVKLEGTPIEPGSCPQVGDPVPETFLTPDPEDISNLSSLSAGGGTEAIAITKAGRHEIAHVSGTVGANCGIWVEESVPSVRLEETGGATIYITDASTNGPINSTVNFGYFSPPTTPFDPVAALQAVYTDGILAYWDVFPPYLDNLGGTWNANFISNGSPNGLSCTPAGAASFVLRRTHSFIPQPASVSIAALASLASSLDCGDGTPTVAWSGLFPAITTYNEGLIQYSVIGPGSIGGTPVFNALITGQAGIGWSMTITKSGGIIWTGTKSYGETAVGNYARGSSCNPDAPTCLQVGTLYEVT